MRRWTHSLFQTDPLGHFMVAATGEGPGGTSYNMLFYQHDATGDVPSAELFPARLLCHVLLAKIPDEGVPEALECLSVIWDHGRPALVAAPPRAPIVRTAKVVARRHADPIVIAEG